MTKTKRYVLIDKYGGRLSANATNYIKAAKLMVVSAYELRTYGHIEEPQNDFSSRTHQIANSDLNHYPCKCDNCLKELSKREYKQGSGLCLKCVDILQ